MRHSKSIIVVCFSALLIFGFSSGIPAEAHGSEAPYVKINGEYAEENPILDIVEPVSFEIGADIASSEGYLAGQTITFAIDEQFFPNPYSQAQNSFGLPVTSAPEAPRPQFRWDFRDGSPKKEGKSVLHAFTKPGTYIVELEARFEGKTEFAAVNTIEVLVSPSKDYVVPVPKITVDGKMITDRGDTATIKPARPVVFDASSSTGDIVDFQWDFGDEKGARGKTVTHRYARDAYFPVVVLRVTDKNNVTADAYILLDSPFEKPNFFLGIWYAMSDFVTGLFYKE